MKMTIITSDDGRIVGFTHGHGRARRFEEAQDAGAPREFGLQAGPGQKLEEVDVPDDLADIEDGEELRSRLQKHLKRGYAS